MNNRKTCDVTTRRVILCRSASPLSCVSGVFKAVGFCLFLQLTQITRTGQCTWDSKNILAVSFAPLAQQSRADGDKPDTVHLREFCQPPGACLCVCVIGTKRS